MPTRSGGTAYKPYIAGRTALAAPTFTAVAPTTGTIVAGTVALTLTGTFTVGTQYYLLCDNVPEQYCVVTNGTTATVTIRTSNKTAAAHKLRVIDPQGQMSAVDVTFTVS